MTEPNIPVAVAPELIDIDDDPPRNGELVLALGLGGVLCREVWGSQSHKFFVAWMKHPKVPPKVKEKLMKQYQNKS